MPRIVFTKGGGLWLESLAGIGADALGLDWSVDIGAARARVGDRVALQGNLDPAVLLTEPEVVRSEAAQGAGRIRPRRGPRVQSRPRGVAAHAARERGSAGGRCARAQPRLSRVSAPPAPAAEH